MGLIELAKSLGMDKGLCSRLVKKGMPTTSAEAANAWRAIHAKPRAKRCGASAPSPITKSITASHQSSVSPKALERPLQTTTSLSNESSADDDGPSESLRRAKAAERASYKHLVDFQKDKNASPEDLRKSSSIYFSSRTNRQKAEADHREFLRAEGVTLFYAEAADLAGRPHEAVRAMLSTAAKSLTPRLVGMPAKSIEDALAAWIDRLTEMLRSSL